MKFTQRRGVSLLKSKGTMAPLNTSCFSSSWGRWNPQRAGEGGLGRPEEGPAECFINPIKQVDGEDLTDNLHLANEACDS